METEEGELLPQQEAAVVVEEEVVEEEEEEEEIEAEVERPAQRLEVAAEVKERPAQRRRVGASVGAASHERWDASDDFERRLRSLNRQAECAVALDCLAAAVAPRPTAGPLEPCRLRAPPPPPPARPAAPPPAAPPLAAPPVAAPPLAAPPPACRGSSSHSWSSLPDLVSRASSAASASID